MGLFSFLFGKKGKGGFWGRSRIDFETEQKIKADWKKIETLLKGGSPSQLKDALLTADKALDNALRDLVEGNNMGQRLKNAKDLFDWETYDKIWKAHKLRNSLVHESGYEPTHGMIKDGVTRLKQGLSDLGVKL